MTGPGRSWTGATDLSGPTALGPAPAPVPAPPRLGSGSEGHVGSPAWSPYMSRDQRSPSSPEKLRPAAPARFLPTRPGGSQRAAAARGRVLRGVLGLAVHRVRFPTLVFTLSGCALRVLRSSGGWTMLAIDLLAPLTMRQDIPLTLLGSGATEFSKTWSLTSSDSQQECKAWCAQFRLHQ